MEHKDRYTAKRYDTANRLRAFTDIVYSGESGDKNELWKKLSEVNRSLDEPAPTLIPLTGEMHGHSNMSDGGVDVDTYFTNIRDIAKLDFAVLTDHDHGGVGRPELWVGNPSKWDIIKKKAVEYRVPGKFSTLLGYERDSYPFYNNMILYFKNDDAELFRGEHDGEITEEELRTLLSRDDVVVCPHDTYSLTSGADFTTLPKELITPFIEVISRGDAAEYMGNPAWDTVAMLEGGFWQDALKRGAKVCVIGGSDDHGGMNGQVDDNRTYPVKFPGVTGVWATENSPTAIFSALKAGRTYAYMLGYRDGDMKGRMVMDFRINGHFMGETIKRPETNELKIYYNVDADVPVKKVTIVKNLRDAIALKANRELILDYKQETETDCYYLRVELADGRFGWSSPIWVEA